MHIIFAAVYAVMWCVCVSVTFVDNVFTLLTIPRSQMRWVYAMVMSFCSSVRPL